MSKDRQSSKLRADKITTDLYCVGAKDPDLRVFDIVMESEYGTTYNSFLLKDKHNILFESVKAKFYDQLCARLDDILGEGEKLDYIVVNHTEPDHSGCVLRLMKERYPDAVVVGTAPAIRFLRQISNVPDFKFIQVPATGKTMNISSGKYTISFYPAPLLHWPDSMFSHIEELNVAITCDFFGSHWSFPEGSPFLSEILKKKLDNYGLEDYEDARQYYYDCIFGPFPSWVQNGLKIINNLIRPHIVCCSHGPILDGEFLLHTLKLYDTWSTTALTDSHIASSTPHFVVAYVSAYGYTAEMAKSVVQGIKESVDDVLSRSKSGKSIPIEIYDLVVDDIEMVKSRIEGCLALFLGTPTINGDALPQMKELAEAISPIRDRGLVCGVFGSYGWSGEGPDVLAGRIRALKLKMPVSPLKIEFRSSKEDIEKCRKLGNVVSSVSMGLVEEGESVDFVNPSSGSGAIISSSSSVKVDGKNHWWRCVVCNEVFYGVSPPSSCPVCGAGLESFVCADDEMKRKRGVRVCKKKEDSDLLETGSSSRRNSVCESEAEEDEIEEEDHARGKSIVIIGGGAAGLSAAKEARKESSVAIHLICREQLLPYNRTKLTSFVGGECIEQDLLLEQSYFYEEYNIQVHIGWQVASIDKEKKEIYMHPSKPVYKCADGPESQRDPELTTLSFDSLIIASGSSPFIPTFIPGIACSPKSLAKGVYVMRNMDDSERIAQAVREIGEGCHVALVGGGVLNLEAIPHFLHIPTVAKVTVYERADFIMCRQLDSVSSDMLEKVVRDKAWLIEKEHREKRGETVVRGSIENERLCMRKSVTVRGVVHGKEDGSPSAIQASYHNGREIVDKADVIVVSIGARPLVGFLEGSEVQLGKFGVKVDESMQCISTDGSSISGIFAAGDCSYIERRNLPTSWARAQKCGSIAGYNAVLHCCRICKCGCSAEGIPCHDGSIEQYEELAEDQSFAYMLHMWDIEIVSSGDATSIDPLKGSCLVRQSTCPKTGINRIIRIGFDSDGKASAIVCVGVKGDPVFKLLNSVWRGVGFEECRRVMNDLGF
ncbi:disulfide oxidoreductase, putative [Aduncisulcus paluster]|uniref:Disulfide oxidoreductase, putative n=1 Tax=Aduncisulcus paluster TaxID=2918883 RepID=A0ABQ5K857_9EUKA|nr:disulfide oxidoreductase, putative [Aduncisulcus paluster]